MAIPLDMTFEAFHIHGEARQDIMEGVRSSISALTNGDLRVGNAVRADHQHRINDQSQALCITEAFDDWVTVVCQPPLMLHILRRTGWSAIGLFGQCEQGRRSIYGYWNLLTVEAGQTEHWLISSPENALSDVGIRTAQELLDPFLSVYYPGRQPTTLLSNTMANIPREVFWRVEDFPLHWLKPNVDDLFLRAMLQEPTHTAFLRLAEAILAPGAAILTGYSAYNDFWAKWPEANSRQRTGQPKPEELIKGTEVLSCTWREGYPRKRGQIEFGHLFSWLA